VEPADDHHDAFERPLRRRRRYRITPRAVIQEGTAATEARGGDSMTFAGRQVGDLTIARALEIITPFDRAAFFPETAPADWAPHESWLKPKAMDPSGALLFPVQSYLVRTAHHTILIDSCVGNDKQRPNRPAWHMKSDDTYMRALHGLGLTLEDIDFVMCTHMHSDHVGWNTRLVDGRCSRPFPTPATCSPGRSSRRGSRATRSSRASRSRTACCRRSPPGRPSW
jgi:hypothetical protein